MRGDKNRGRFDLSPVFLIVVLGVDRRFALVSHCKD